GKLLAIVSNPNQEKYVGQKIYIIEIDNYAYLVPFVETKNEIFLKTIIPSRKAAKKYLEVRDEK
ncbi:MAG: toxin, partial [Candidatus Humimicrobiaceae bacterium]